MQFGCLPGNSGQAVERGIEGVGERVFGQVACGQGMTFSLNPCLEYTVLIPMEVHFATQASWSQLKAKMIGPLQIIEGGDVKIFGAARFPSIRGGLR